MKHITTTAALIMAVVAPEFALLWVIIGMAGAYTMGAEKYGKL